MTIDEHWLYMVILESFLFLAGFGVSTLVNWLGQRKLQKTIDNLIDEPEHAAKVGTHMWWAILNDITSDPEKEELFVKFVTGLAITAVDGVRNYFSEHVTPEGSIPKEALKGMPKEVKTAVRFADMLGIDLKSMIKKRAHAQAETIIEDAFGGAVG